MDNHQINQLIIDTIVECSDDENICKLIEESLRYELDIWNRHVFASNIRDQYDQLVKKVLKK